MMAARADFMPGQPLFIESATYVQSLYFRK